MKSNTMMAGPLFVSAIAAMFGLADCGQANAQQGTVPAKWADTISAEIDKATIAGDAAKLDAAAAMATRVATAYPSDGLILHYQGYALYRQANMKMVNGGDGSPLLEQAVPILQRSLKTHPLPETYMLLSSIDGQLIGQNPSRAMELGVEAQTSSETALAMGPNNPRVWLLRGQAAIFTPPEYGGGLSLAEQQLKHAIELFAKDAPKPGEPSWGKAEACLWLGQVYEKKGDKANAAAMYKQALDISPTYGYAQVLAAALK